ncbi:MAG: type IV pilus modification PilV family protein [Acidimicrobiales bacterium]
MGPSVRSHPPAERAAAGRAADDSGFSIIEVVVATLVLMILLVSLTYVLTGSLTEVAFAEQRLGAVKLANQAISEVQALPVATLEQGMSPSDLQISSDQNIQGGTLGGSCFGGQWLIIGATPGGSAALPGSACPSTGAAWHDPSCLTGAGPWSAPSPVANPLQVLVSGTLTYTHQVCYQSGSTTYGVDAYLTQPAAGAAYTLTVAVSWSRPFVAGLSDHIVTTTQVGTCALGATCP